MYPSTPAQDQSCHTQTVPDRQFPAEARILSQLDRCLHRGCVITIEHTHLVQPRYTPWELWEPPCCYTGDMAVLHDSIERCRHAHADHHIRLSIEDLSWHSRLSLVVHRPH